MGAILVCTALSGGTALGAGGIVPDILYAPGELPQTPAPAPGGGILDQDQLLGDMGGLRSGLAKYGVSIHLGETSEILDNVSGGIGRGPLYEGLTDLNVGWDLRTAFDWRGVFFARVYQIHGRGLTTNEVDNLNTISGIEATRTTRLFEAWYEQHIGDWLRIRIGQQSAGQEFIVTSTARLFVNGAFGWPTLPSADLPSGGPGFPLGTPAVRFRIDFNDELTLFSGVFDGNPTGAPLGTPNPQTYDLSGTAFRTSDGVLWINEVRYNPGNSPATGGYRLGAWYDSERFPDLGLASNGAPLASPASTGVPRRYNGDFSFYGIVDQPIFRKDDSDNGFSVFARAMGAPGDRNLVDLYLDGGVTYKGLTGHGDTIGLGVAYAHIGNVARALDTEQALLNGGLTPVQSSETAVELTYQFNVAKWWTLQPDLQYIVNPGGGIPNPQAPTSRIRNAVVAGLRTIITF
jgi:porin